jgi:hypothetical protein
MMRNGKPFPKLNHKTNSIRIAQKIPDKYKKLLEKKD